MSQAGGRLVNRAQRIAGYLTGRRVFRCIQKNHQFRFADRFGQLWHPLLVGVNPSVWITQAIPQTTGNMQRDSVVAAKCISTRED